MQSPILGIAGSGCASHEKKKPPGGGFFTVLRTGFTASLLYSE